MLDKREGEAGWVQMEQLLEMSKDELAAHDPNAWWKQRSSSEEEDFDEEFEEEEVEVVEFKANSEEA